MRLLIVALCCLALPALAGDALPSWMKPHAEHAEWLKGSTDEAPRAIVKLNSNDVEIIFWLPDRTPKQIKDTVYQYDAYKRTEQVESSFQADGHFFTGTRVLGNFNPAVTKNTAKVGEDSLLIQWELVSTEDALAYLRAHEAEVRNCVEKQLSWSTTFEKYMAEIESRIDVLAKVEGSHEYEGGFYRYRQIAYPKNQAIQSLVNAVGKQPQRRAALKAAAFSVGKHNWAGAQGRSGELFEVRGDYEGTMRPGQ